MKTIFFPSQCESDISCYKRIFPSFFDALQSPSEEVYIDCGHIRFIRPLGLNILAAIIRRLAKNHKGIINFSPPTNSPCHTYLEDQGFFNEFLIKGSVIQPSPRSTSVALRNLEVLDGFYFEQIANWLNKNSFFPPQVIGDVVKIPLGEVINNTLDHSQSLIGCYVSAQAYPQENRLLLSVVDLGVGILATLLPRYGDKVKTHVQAIALAIQPGVSCKSRGGNAGAGLDILAGFLALYGGKLEIISMCGRWIQTTEGACLSEELPFTFPGTCINIEFNNQTILDRYKLNSSYD